MTLVVARRECALQVVRRLLRSGGLPEIYYVDEDKCVGCTLCVQLGCPAVGFDKERKKAWIDPVLCIGCGMCAQTCPVDAIHVKPKEGR